VTVAVGDRDVEHREELLLEHAFAEAEARKASLTVLHAWYVPPDYGEVYLDEALLDQWRAESRRDLQEHVATWAAAHPSVEVRVEVPRLRPADALVRASRRTDLLVVARRRSHGLVHLGSVVRAVVRESRCPVLIVTPDTPDRIDRSAADEPAQAEKVPTS
jgi:nucleotide-binding universal stress UspA family protein